jgi:4,5-DOPA dioxygenase extradiol
MGKQLMPAVFFGHGSPMNALDHNRYTESWRAFGAAVPRPRAILAVSAHWYIESIAVTAMAQPRTIHDFYGFPPELFAIQYPAPGASDVAAEVVELLKPTSVDLDEKNWGIDHGTWSVLVHAYPKADIPVVQLSIDARKPFDEHVEIGARLAPLRERGVLIAASGSVVHNLRRMSRNEPDAAFDWNVRFDDAVKEVMTSSPADIVQLRNHPDYELAAPTPDHFIPLLYLAGLARAAGRPVETLVEGYSMGSLSMTSYVLAGA